MGEADGLSQTVSANLMEQTAQPTQVRNRGLSLPVGDADGQSKPVCEADGLCNGDGAGFLGEEVSDVIHLLVVLPSS